MKLASCLIFSAVGSAVAMPRLLSTENAEVIEGEYVVTLKSGRSKAACSKMASSFNSMGEFSIGKTFKGFSAKLSPEQLVKVLASPDVDMVSPNVKVYATGIIGGRTFKLNAPNVTSTKSKISCADTQADGYSWGQARVTSETVAELENGYQHDASWGAGVDFYVIDTGTLCSHEDFAGRSCECGPNFSKFIGAPDMTGGCDDGNGHGTFCSSIAAGNVYGVAKGANIIGVKSLGDLGSGSLNGIVDGFNWIAEAAAASGNPSVASVSLGTQGTNALVDAAANALAEVVMTAIAAGNAGQTPEFADTCTGSSPGAAEKPITVGSSAIDDTRSFFSNYGACNDIYAPGSDITGAFSTKPGSDGVYPTDQYITGSGTSMATPHVAGALAAMLGDDLSLTPEALKAKILGDSLTDKIDHVCDLATTGSDLCELTPNQLLHIAC